MSKAKVPAIVSKGYSRKVEAKLTVKPLGEGGEVVLQVADAEIPLGFNVTLIDPKGAKAGTYRFYTRSDQPGEVYSSVDVLLADEFDKLTAVFDKLMAGESDS